MGCCGSKHDPNDKLGGLQQTTAGLSPTPGGVNEDERPESSGSPISRAYSVLPEDPTAPKPKTFVGKYLGRVPVRQIQGDGVVRDAHMRLAREYTEKVKKITMTVAVTGLQAIANKKQIIQDTLIQEISFCTLNSKDPQSLSFITRDRNNIALCHFYRIKSGAREVHSAIAAAFKYTFEADSRENERNDDAEVRRYARTSSLSDGSDQDNAGGNLVTSDAAIGEQDETAPIENSVTAEESKKGHDLSEVLGTFEVMYFGSVPCHEMRGQHVVLQKMGMLLQSGRMQPQPVALQITGEGIKAIDVISSQPVMNSSMIQVSFTTTISEKSALRGLRQHNKEFGQSVFAYILKDERLSRLTVSIFGCRTPKMSTEIAKAVNKAFQIQVEIKKMRQGNPFAAVSSARDTVPMTLFPIQIHRADVTASKVIGMGQYGEVYLASQKVKSDDGSVVDIERAVKILRKSAGQADRVEFLREAEVMVKLKHPNLVQITGVAVQQRPWLTVLEYVKYGDLLAVVKTAAEKNFEITYREHLHWTEQMAAGMAYIASKNMIHMDLAARNVLLGERNVCKIADFGLTRELPPGKSYYRLMQTLKLPIKWMAIESIRDKIFTVKTDVWGFGIMVWEVLSYGEIPYGDVKNIEVENLVTQGMRLQCVEGCPVEFHDMLSKCWIRNPGMRPDFNMIHAKVRQLAEAAKGSYPDIRPDVGAALHDEEIPVGPSDTTSTPQPVHATPQDNEQEFVIEDQGAKQWQQTKDAVANQTSTPASGVAQVANGSNIVAPDLDDEDGSGDEMDI